MRRIVVAMAMLCVAGVSQAAEIYDAETMTLTVTADSFAATVDPVGEMQDWDANYQQPAMTLDEFNALPGLKTITFNGCTTQFQKVAVIKAYYDAETYVTFTGFGNSNGYNYGGGTSAGRTAHSGSQAYHHLGTEGGNLPGDSYRGDAATVSAGLNWLKMTISVSDPSWGVSAIGFIVDGRSDQNTQDGNIWVDLSDGSSVALTYGTFAGSGAAQGLFFGYQAPAGKFITGIECTRKNKSGNSYLALDDLSFVLVDTSAPQPPSKITDLAASDPTENSVTLTWTAPGDDGDTGTAASYDIRYATTAITEANFASAQPVVSPPAPAAAGTPQSFTVTGLDAYTTYYFAIKTTGQGGLVSQLSNVASIRTAASTNDTIPPHAVTDLATASPSYTTMTLQWTAPADPNSPCSAHDIRFATEPITESNWADAVPVDEPPAPRAPGSSQYFVVGGLRPATTYYFAIKTRDAAGNVSALSNVSAGTTLTSPAQAAKPLLTQADFRYRGYYVVPTGGSFRETHWGQGFTHRYVDGQLRFLTFSFFGNQPGGGYQLIEFAAPAELGGTVTFTNHWPDIWTGIGMSPTGGWMGLWYEQAKERLWTTWAIDYPNDTQAQYTRSLAIRTLNADGTVSGGSGPWGLEGVQQRRIYGGVQAIPQWFQDLYGVGSYAVGWGGYASRMGLGVSLGPTLYAIPEPTDYPAGENSIPTTAFQTLMDHASGTRASDWYAAGAPTSFDRGVRNSDVINEYDSGNWLSPAPDGVGRWTWGDSAWNTGCWIDQPTRQGFIIVPKFSSGRAWYETSTLHCERQTAEIHVFDPRELSEVALGIRPVWKTYPASRWQITDVCQSLGLMYGIGGNGPRGGPAGASYDPVTRQLYIYCIWGTGSKSYILVYDVGPIPGDIDGDGHVNVFDVFVIAESWNTALGEANYNPECDLDGDGFVNVFDIFVLAENWNR